MKRVKIQKCIVITFFCSKTFFINSCEIIDKEKLNETISSSNISIPCDYDTDVLRNELTQFGAPPGPIMKTTKRLYMKQLLRFQRNPEMIEHAKNIAISTCEKKGKFYF